MLLLGQGNFKSFEKTSKIGGTLQGVDRGDIGFYRDCIGFRGSPNQGYLCGSPNDKDYSKLGLCWEITIWRLPKIWSPFEEDIGIIEGYGGL